MGIHICCQLKEYHNFKAALSALLTIFTAQQNFMTDIQCPVQQQQKKTEYMSHFKKTLLIIFEYEETKMTHKEKVKYR